MKTVGEKISELRKSKGMTQEELATTIGVSTQSVSKWENNTNMPDIMLLPVIAEIFGVTIDELFGRGNEQHRVGFPNLFDYMNNAFIFTLQREFFDNYNQKSGDTLENRIQNCIEYLKAHPYAQTGVYSGKNGAVYYSEPTGGVLLRKNENGWVSLLNDESVTNAIQALSDRDYRMVLRYIAENSTTFTLPMIMKTGLSDEAKAEKILFALSEKDLLKIEKINTGETDILVYQPCTSTIKERMLVLYIALTYLKRFEEFKNSFYSWCG